MAGRGDGDDIHGALGAEEIVGVSGVKRQPVDRGDGGDHQIRFAVAWLAVSGDHPGDDHAVLASGLSVERQRFKDCLDSLQTRHPAAALGRILGLVYPCRQFGQGNGASE